MQTDVAVIGAGAAGLAAARRLQDRGIEFLVLEARDRIGGRAYTVQARDGVPVELGAEFIHGRPSVTFELLRECGAQAAAGAGAMLQLREGRLQPALDVWESTDRLLQRVDLQAADLSVETYLERLRNDGVAAQELDAFRGLVEGFDAVIASDASVIGIAKEWRSGVNDEISRPSSGYGPLMRHLASLVDSGISLQTRVLEVQWMGDGVRILATRAGSPLEIQAKHAIVTLPIGVLREQRVHFVPPLPEEKQAAIDAIAMGPVTRVMLEFDAPFWPDASFFQAPECAMPTMWTRFPQRIPVLAAWAGGGAVQRLSARDMDPIAAAMDTVQTLFPSIDAHARLRASYHHDWQADPFSCGAYRYLRVGGGDARAQLGKPIAQKLFFAGEATSTGDSGTVAGALESGYRAADEVRGL